MRGDIVKLGRIRFKITEIRNVDEEFASGGSESEEEEMQRASTLNMNPSGMDSRS